jgi:hypothetical protein
MTYFVLMRTFSMLSRSKCQKLLTFRRILPKTQDQEPISTKSNSSPILDFSLGPIVLNIEDT